MKPISVFNPLGYQARVSILLLDYVPLNSTSKHFAESEFIYSGQIKDMALEDILSHYKNVYITLELR